ncbi:MAG: hypothetical protein K9K38_06615 [Rhodoferax sp.]|nr:hypothetical protein [Rhodoferax sp.]
MKKLNMTVTPLNVSRRPAPPEALPAGAAELWITICKSVDPDYFGKGDLVLLEALVRADSHKRQCDALVELTGPIMPDGSPSAALKMSVTLAASMASLASKLRLSKSSTTRADSAGLKKALLNGADADTPASRYFK